MFSNIPLPVEHEFVIALSVLSVFKHLSVSLPEEYEFVIPLSVLNVFKHHSTSRA